MTLLSVDRLTIAFGPATAPIPIVREVSFDLAAGNTLGIVGESGSGKSMTALSLIGLLPETARVGGQILFDGADMVSASERDWLPLRGRRIGFVFQEPMTSLNPVHTIGRQIVEGLRLHGLKDAAAARSEALRLLDRVRLPRAAERLDAFPHELSGGQRQRVMIAIAIACNPALLIADEPTSALDVTVQRQIVGLLKEVQAETGMGLIVISHDLGVIADVADRSLVLYGGRVMEEGPTHSLFRDAAHPYTRGLIAARPGRHLAKGTRLPAIRGNVPAAADFAPGCPFYGRCDFGVDLCRDTPPKPVVSPSSSARCHFAGVTA